MNSLGICIPTYKRPAFLRRCVFSAIEAAGGRPLRIFIADDSLDNTNTAIYEEFKAHSDCIVVQRNTINLGIDDNIQQAVDLCSCDYAWIVGEDDFFLPDSIRRVFDGIQGSQAPFIFANYSYVGDENKLLLGQALEEPDGSISGRVFIASHLWAAGFIGACIVNRSRWATTTTAHYKKTYYTHLGRICEMLAHANSSVMILAEPCVANRVEGEDTFTWKSDSYGVFFGFCAMCESVARQHPFLADAARQAINVMERRYGWLSLRLAMRLRSEFGYDVAQYQCYIAPNISNRLVRFAFYCISVSPPRVFRPLVLVHRWMRKRKSR